MRSFGSRSKIHTRNHFADNENFFFSSIPIDFNGADIKDQQQKKWEKTQ